MLAAAGAVLALTACGDDGAPAGVYELRASEADEYPTGYAESVVADPDGHDLAEGGGEHVVVANNATIRTELM